VDGCGQRQDDGLLHSCILGRATLSIDWDKLTNTLQVNGRTYKVYLPPVVNASG
jgi:hypothetical protein